jgi:hypothetical protein
MILANKTENAPNLQYNLEIKTSVLCTAKSLNLNSNLHSKASVIIPLRTQRKIY